MNKRKIIILISTLITATVLTLLTVFVILPNFRTKTVKETIAEAMKKTNNSLGPSNKILGMGKLSDKMKERTYDSYFSFTLSDTDIEQLSMFKGLSLSESHIIYDPKTDNFILSTGISFAEVMELINVTLYGTEEGYGISSSTLFDGYAYINKNDILTLANNNKPLLESALKNNAPDIDTTDLFLSLNKQKNIEEIIEQSNDKLIYEKISETNYKITLNKESIEEILNEIKPFLSNIIGEAESENIKNGLDVIKENIVINLEVDANGYLTKIELQDFNVGNMTFSYSCTFKETEQLFNVKLTQSDANGTTIPLVAFEHRIFALDDNETVNTVMNLTIRDINILELAGSYTDYEKGKSFNFDLEKLRIYNGEEFITLTGYYGVTPYSGSIDFPKTNRYNIAVPEEMNTLIQTITQNLNNNLLFNLFKDYVPIG